MAPRMPRDCHGAADPNSYSPRTSSNRSEDHLPRAHDVGDTAIIGKEAFFRSMGLRMKGCQFGYTTLDGVRRTKKINVPREVKLRDCSVVVPGAMCRICGKYFKCVTDVNAHAASRHRQYETNGVVVSGELSCARDSSRGREASPKPAEQQATIPKGKSPGAKPGGKLRLTLRIGAEVVVRRDMKRKHLRIHTDIATQTESAHRVEELIMRKCESSVPRIDLPVLDNSPCQCCTSSMRVVNSTNQYLAGNIVACKDTDCEASATNKGSPALDRLAESCATSTGEKVNGAPVSPSNVTRTVARNDTAGMLCFRVGNPDELSARHYLSPVSDLNDNSWLTSCSSVRNDNPEIVSDDSGILSEQAAESLEKDINANETPREKPFEKQSLRNLGATSPVVVPIIIPIIVSNNDTTPPANKIQHRPPIPSQQRNPTPPFVAERNADDEVQEVLRIIRGHAISEGINHESPNRSEQEMLLRDAIKDMLQMEEQGWHLLERGDTAEPARKRRRAGGKSDTRNGNANDDSVRRKKRATAQPSFDGNVIRSVSNENYVSSTKELLAMVQKSSQSRVCITDSVKENVMMFNGNINVPSEVLHRYGINYYNEPFEINNNTETVQGTVNRFLVPCSGGTENRGSRPTVIDLVNDTDE
ncbi:uncharacterized protein LOC143367498 [Andrena cerasifolii]|uniref:uncharacterized protein LOC143367498 n=1 Tax=Andrena cerasifolii TaxID=2819439 RepID=UPI0040380DFE